MSILDKLNIKNITCQGCSIQETLQHNLFVEALSSISSNDPVMIELGANDALYSIIFNKFFNDKNALNICVEACEKYREIGLTNITNTNCQNIHYIDGIVGDMNMDYFNLIERYHPGMQGQLSPKIISLAQLIETYKIKTIDILHMDIQGSEVSVLNEILTTKLYDKIKYAFISTHRGEEYGDDQTTHYTCKKIIDLMQCEKQYLYDNKDDGGCGDGLIVVKF